MKVQLDWLNPIPMRPASRRSSQYIADTDDLPQEPGIYVFGRTHGRAFEALYVGQANQLRARIEQQLNNLRLMDYVRQARQGRRLIMVGTLTRGRIASSLTIAERALIRYFLAQGHDLANIHGAKRRQHEVESRYRPMHFVPLLMYVDQG